MAAGEAPREGHTVADKYAPNDQTVARFEDRHIFKFSCATQIGQRLLNNHLPAGERLVDEGFYDGPTKRAANRFQEKHGLEVLPRMSLVTLAKLGLTVEVNHPVTLIPQPKKHTCWKAAARMMLGGHHPRMSCRRQQCNGQSGDAAVKVNLTKFGELDNSDANMRNFGIAQGWQMFTKADYGTRLDSALQAGPVWMAGWIPRPERERDNSHVVVITGWVTYTGTTFDGTIVRGKALKVFDPFPNNLGQTYYLDYDDPVLPSGRKFHAEHFLALR